MRDIAGHKLILGGGGGKGAWSPEQLPNTSTLTGMFTAAAPVDAPGDVQLYNVTTDPGERDSLPLGEHAAVVQSLQAIVAHYNATKVPQQENDPSCPNYAPRTSAKGPWVRCAHAWGARTPGRWCGWVWILCGCGP